MKSKSLFIPMFLVLLAVVACNAAAGQGPATEMADPGDSKTAQPDAGTAFDALSLADCPEASPGAHQLIDAARGVCLLYPDAFDVFEHSDGGGYTLYVQSLLNSEAPAIVFTFEPANGRSLEEITTQRLTDYAFPNTQSQAIRLGNEPASMLDDLPGQDANRRIVALHDDRVIDIMIDHIGENYGAAGEQAEAAYNMITSSFKFIGIDPEAPLIAGPECPEPVEDSTIYTNEPGGYCLLVPAAYTVEQINPEASEMAFFVGAIQDASHARLFIAVEDSGQHSLDEATAAIAAEIEKVIPAFEVMPSFGYMLDGVPANQFDQVPGQDLSRQVVAVHDDRLYKLTFIPDDPTADAYVEMQTLYDMVMDSFSFTTTERDGGMETSSAALTGSIFGWVWHDVCESGQSGEPSPALPPEGCIEADSAQGPYYRADGNKDALEPVIPEIVVRLGQGACPSSGLAEFVTIATDISYSFTGLNAGTYCVSINSLEEPNFSLLIPGMWTYPEVLDGTIGKTVTLEEGHNVYDINFGWDYQFFP